MKGVVLMNKFLKYNIVMLIVVLLLLASFFTTAQATSREFQITAYDIQVNILTDGSADIEEKITYAFKGNFNGGLFDLDFSGSKGLVDPRVYIEKAGHIKESVHNNSSNSGTYMFNVDGNIAKFKVFEPSSNETVTFIYTYRLLDVVTKYNDIAEFNRKMIGTNWDVPVQNVNIYITIPKGGSKDELRVFAHGPLTGESWPIDSHTAHFKAPAINPGKFFETRVLFPQRLVPESQNIVNKNALEEILAQEAIWANEANKEREKARQKLENAKTLKLIGQILTALFLLLWLFIMLKLKKKYGTKYNTTFEGKYYRELPDNYPPAELRYLLSGVTGLQTDILATLLDLVRRRILLLETEKIMQKGFLKKKENISYRFTKKPQGDIKSLSRHETFLISWLFDQVGNGQTFLLSDIKDFVKKEASARVFKSHYIMWKNLIRKTAQNKRFYPEGSGKAFGAKLLVFIAFFVAGGLISATTGYHYAAILSLLGFVTLFIRITNKHSEYGADQNAKWQALKRFIKDFSNIKDASLPSIAIWEHYLVYAIVLGVANESMKQLTAILAKESNETLMYSAIAGKMFINNQNNYDFNSFNAAFNQMNSAISSAFSVANSHTSSSSGSGGGASGGNSGGGGGASGGGAF